MRLSKSFIPPKKVHPEKIEIFEEKFQCVLEALTDVAFCSQ